MAEQLVCLRSPWATLTAAASTFALFAAANWGLAALADLGSDTGSKGVEVLGHTIFAFGAPLFPLFLSICNALTVRTLKRRLAAHQALSHSCVSMIALCPIFLQLPAGADIPQRLRGCKLVTMSWEEFEDQVCPLELQPARDDMPGHTVGAHTDAASAHDISWVCLELPVALDDIGCRRALLSAGLSPKQKKLSFIRARNRFQTVVTALQAGGNILGLLQRLVQRLGISPIEAIATFLSILVALQLLIELYACGNYQRPLLLKLDSAQLLQFNEDAHWIADLEASNQQNGHIAAIATIMVWLLLSVPALYYFGHYVHMHRISAFSSFLFFLSQTLLIPFFFLLASNSSHDNIGMSLLVCSVLLYGSSLIVAVVGTIEEWRAFHNPSLHNWFAWILPHVSS